MKSDANPSSTPGDGTKAFVRSFYEELWNRKEIRNSKDFVAADIVLHSPGAPDVRGLAAFEEWLTRYMASVPDYHIDLHDIVLDGTTVAIRWTCTGTHKGILFGLAPTGKKFTLTGMSFFRLANGKLAQGWVERDVHGLAKRLAA